jgi:hypothetical protein
VQARPSNKAAVGLRDDVRVGGWEGGTGIGGWGGAGPGAGAGWEMQRRCSTVAVAIWRVTENEHYYHFGLFV